jgi:hypothetical protein
MNNPVTPEIDNDEDEDEAYWAEEFKRMFRQMKDEAERPPEPSGPPVPFSAQGMLRFPATNGRVRLRFVSIVVGAQDHAEARLQALGVVRCRLDEPTNCPPDERRILGVTAVGFCERVGHGALIGWQEIELQNANVLDAFLRGEPALVRLVRPPTELP